MTIRIVVVLVLAVLAAECVVLFVVTSGSSRGPRFAALAPNLAAGGFLVLAIGSATLADPLAPVALFVALGGVAHAWDLRHRLRGPSRD